MGMEIEYRRLTEKELDIFIEKRIHQLREEGAKEEIDLVPALKDYYQRHMADGTFVSWIALDGNKMIGTSGNHRISDVRVERLDYCPVCIQILITEEKVLRRNYYPV